MTTAHLDLPTPLPALMPLEGAVRAYAWGSRTFLAELRGEPAPSAEPQAELWLGDHPTAPALARIGDRAIPLDALIAARPREILGPSADRAAGSRLPFLLKILAAEQPLSLQLHPDARTARGGFAREEAAGIPRDDPRRLYPDPWEKPEIACALTRFTALQGLRPAAEARALLARLGTRAARVVLERTDPEEPAALLRATLALDRHAAASLAVELVAGLGVLPDAESAAVERLAKSWPGEALIAAPLLMNLVELEPGEALFTPPRVLHSYLGGAAVELMGSSDDVLRAGLTSKHVEPSEVLRVLDPRPRPPRVLRAEPAPGTPWRHFPGTAPIRLALADLEPDGGSGELAEPAALEPHLLLVTRGALLARPDDGGPEIALGPGQAALVRGGAPPYRLKGAGRVYRAGSAPDG